MRHNRARWESKKWKVGSSRKFLLAALLLTATAQAQNNPMPIRNGVLQNNLNANGHQIQNLDTSNLGLGGGGGIDTGTTTAIIKGNGAHGIADAVAGTDYLAPTGSGILLTGVVLSANNLSDIADAAVARTNLGISNVNNTSDVAKPVSTATSTALSTKADAASVTTALSAKADAATVTTSLASKEPLLPTSPSNGYILSRNVDTTWHFVDPVTLGTTSQSFTDGVENSTTTFTSATANFVASDVGKTITGTNIPAATTIASRTNATTIVLSNAATATASGITFTILNRLEVGGTGTVTSVAQTNNASEILTVNLTNPTTSPAFTFDKPTVAANTFYGNATAFSAAPSFMSPATARTSLGLGTMALQANTGTSSFIQKGNGTGGLSQATAGVDYLVPTGSGTTLTGVLKTANNLNDVNAAAAKTNLGLATVASSGAFFDLNAPVVGTTTFYGNPAGTTAAAVFMTASVAKSALAIAESDVGNLTADLAARGDSETPFTNAGTTGAPLTWTAGATMAKETQALTAQRFALLPLASAYPAGKLIFYYDDKTTGNFGRVFRRSGSDTINGVTADVAPFIAGTRGSNGNKITSFKSDGISAWSWFGGTGAMDHVEDPIDATKSFRFDASQQTSNVQGIATAGNGATVTTAPSAVTPGVFLTGLDTNGQFFTSQIFQKYVLSTQDDIATIVGNAHTVPNTGDIDNVRLSATLSAPLTVTLPQTLNYGVGQHVFFYDASGSINDTNTVTLVGAGGDTVNGATSIVLNRPFDSRRMVANNSNSNWTVESYGGATGGGLNTDTWHTVTPVSGTATINCLNTVDTNLQIVNITADTTLVMSGVANGMKGRIKIRDVTGNHVVTVPSNFKTPDRSPKGTFLSSTGSNIEDEWTWDFDGSTGAFTPMGLILTQAVVTYNTAADSGPSNAGTANINIGSAATAKYEGVQFLAGSTYSMGKVGLNLRTAGTAGNLTGNIVVDVAPDAIRSVDSGAVVTASSNTVTNATTIATGDVGQRVTGTAIPDPSYIGAIDTGLHTFTVVTTKGGSTPQTISSSGTGVNIWGKPGTSIATSSPVVASGLPSAYSSTYTNFSGFAATILNGGSYWIIPHADAPLNNGVDFVQLLCQGSNIGYIVRVGSAYPPTVLTSNNAKANFITYKP